ncbi:WW domain binding protein 11 [Penicillium odoratum]|uniref:WW domain binding protein 11 n=1 Tax=Penicillium odoratum TaxID=1167516 RepID=UPI0025493BE3|nr:WW domain binding protein 11 [Penicillium odoratum]KAJ5772384.1 WW domain binding protein 11 [Penicillium odoratum]
MAKDKERSVNPAAAHRKQEKQKSLKKGKAEALARRNEKLARRNPDRIQRQIGELKSVEETGGTLRPRDKEVLEALEKDLRAVLKAREALGDKAPKFHPGRGDYGHDGGDAVLGKRRRDEFAPPADSDSSETDEDVRRIPMPRDTPPPIPRQPRKRGEGDREPERRGPHALPSRPPGPEAKKVYEAKPEIRDLRKEAVNKFIPAAVRMKQESIRGHGKLLEPEEMDKLEKAGYSAGTQQPAKTDEQISLEEEERRFKNELKTVQIEEVEDEDA